ncbi:pyridoxamine 5'-phosphate oxidase family protein [Saccharothrix syringae]|uniref:Pyridoxamine 5'-phosphate oxidase family protein n=1 Tax=Saccharothrix syringae TaxID=103733 RepID=A0A5Q0H1L2_SACSY|nr:pyridoxamine 5'-phosphate oxidase family protein [Saccharothrix syringae]QFZ20146.1 pyridoxamine 5'-phosphate oxidase family protein [Saccharothrix syringae]
MTASDVVTSPTPVTEPAWIFSYTATGPSLDWSWADERLSGARNFWLAVPGPDGMPVCRPMWGFWTNGTFWFSTVNRMTEHLQEDGRAILHTESGDEVVIVEGRVERLFGKENLQVIADGYLAKYSHRTVATDEGVFTPQGYGGPGYRLTPKKVLGWEAPRFGTATRWTFPA